MKTHNFKNHTITRSNPPFKSNYSDYKDDLEKDFCGRCAYCNLKVNYITTTPFQVDHFIPYKEFKDKRPELINDYNNLIYSCSKCNNAKRAQYEGDITASVPTNDLFYDPVRTDYNTIFYRNELGAIDSDDEKGQEMIKRIKLYRPIHILAWICEQLDITASRLAEVKQRVSDKELNERLEAARIKIVDKQLDYIKLFISAYNNESILDSLFEK